MEMDLKQVFLSLIMVVFLSACVSIPAIMLSSNGLKKQNINSCTTIDEPGRYELTTSITNGGGTRISQSCIEIRSGNVIVDGNGHTINGRGNSHTVAIDVDTSNSSQNVQITNVVVTDWHKGIAFRNGVPGKIQNVTASSNVYGISIESSQPVMTRDTVLRENLVGIKVSDNSTHIQLWGNEFSGNQVDEI